MSVEVKDLVKDYHQGDKTIFVLRGVSFKIQQGEIVALVGQSGSGKSTLLSILAGLESAQSGEILLNSKSLLGLKKSELTDFRAKHISIVFQQFHLFQHLTALENVMLPLEIKNVNTNIETAAMRLLSEVQLGNRAHHLPSELSGGECQRVAIARALITQPTLCLADEPSGNLDEETGRAVMDVFFNVARTHQTTCLLVTHNMELAKRCDRILHLKAGVLL